MLPHLWRMPQWLAWSCYLVLAALAIAEDWGVRAGEPTPSATQTSDSIPSLAPRVRLAAALAVILAGLTAAWLAIEVRHEVRVTVFQPFRMATVARGIALVLVAGRVVRLWRSAGWLGRTRAILIAVALSGDWLLVVVTLAELAVSTAQAIRGCFSRAGRWRGLDVVVLFTMLALGLNFLGHHDTEYGHIPLLAAWSAGLIFGIVDRWRGCAGKGAGRFAWAPMRVSAAFALAWAIPLASLAAAGLSHDRGLADRPLVRGLVSRCRFTPVPADDIERIAVWCRRHTPAAAIFIGPPGPKTFRLWSLRALAFNRAASPYHASGLSDWFARFQDHVGCHTSPEEFARAYTSDRHGFESRYDAQSALQLAALALRQGATHVIALAPAGNKNHSASLSPDDRLELLHVEGRYAVYRVRLGTLVQRQR
jgi:hypothetical protein